MCDDILGIHPVNMSCDELIIILIVLNDLQYGGILLSLTCKIYDVKMQHNYVNMRHVYVNMHNTLVDMRDTCNYFDMRFNVIISCT